MFSHLPFAAVYMKWIALLNSIFQTVLALCSYNFIVFAYNFELLSLINFWLVFIKLMQREELNFSFYFMYLLAFSLPLLQSISSKV